jgi:hypothetical protein
VLCTVSMPDCMIENTSANPGAVAIHTMIITANVV